MTTPSDDDEATTDPSAVGVIPGVVPERVPLLTWVGVALAEAQRLELAICTHLVINDPNYDPDTDPDVIAKRFDVLRRQPLGNLLNEMYAMSEVTPEFQRDFDALNVARRELAHHIFIRPPFVASAQTPAGRERLITQIRAWAVEFNVAAEMVFRSALRGAARFGTDPRLVYEHARAVGAGEETLASPAESLVGLESTFTPNALERMAQRLGVDNQQSEA